MNKKQKKPLRKNPKDWKKGLSQALLESESEKVTLNSTKDTVILSLNANFVIGSDSNSDSESTNLQNPIAQATHLAVRKYTSDYM